MKQDYKVIGFNFTPELNSQLQEICNDTKMNRSEVVRQLIQKAFVDKKTREIITRNSYWEKAKRKMEGDTSHNVHCVNEEKKDSPHHSDESTLMSVSEDHQLDYNQLTYYFKEGMAKAAKFTKGDRLEWIQFVTNLRANNKDCEVIFYAIDEAIRELRHEHGIEWPEYAELYDESRAIEIAKTRWL